MPCPKPQTPEPRHSPMSSLLTSAGLPAVAGTLACALARAAIASAWRNRTAEALPRHSEPLASPRPCLLASLTLLERDRRSLPLAPPHPRKPSPSKKTIRDVVPAPFAPPHPRNMRHVPGPCSLTCYSPLPYARAGPSSSRFDILTAQYY